MQDTHSHPGSHHLLAAPFPCCLHRAGKSCGEVKDESKDIAWINNWPASAGLAKGHSWSGRACFNAGPKHEAWRLHLAHTIQHNACQSHITNLQDPRGLPRESTAFWLSFLVWKGCH